MIMYRIVKDLVTERDGESYDIGRALSALAVLVYLGLSIYTVVIQNKPFDPQAYGVGIGALFAGLGAYITMKKEDPAHVPTQ